MEKLYNARKKCRELTITTKRGDDQLAFLKPINSELAAMNVL
jgi:hypothetical protein